MRPEEEAQIILDKNWNMALPVNPVEIASKLGINVYYFNDSDNLGGYYIKSKNEIFVNENDSITRQRFSIAHELGHAVMGHGSSPRRNDVVYDRKNYKYNEYEANRFAAALLMPEEAVSTLVNEGNMDLESLSDAFDVSMQAMAIRLNSLGYL